MEVRNKMDRDEFIRGIRKFEEFEKRDSMYKVATFLVSHFWGDFADMSDGLGVLLLTWNQAFYRYGIFDFTNFQNTIEKNFDKIKEFRNKNISDLQSSDEESIKSLFIEFFNALENKKGQSPVAVAKTLHLLSPNFFPLWDRRIAQAYRCNYNNHPEEQYIKFSYIIKGIAAEVSEYNEVKEIMKDNPNKTLLKLIDEYNYSKYTQHWV